jgi:predicted permease
MEIPLLAGRTLSATDVSTSPRVAVVNQAFAKLYFPNDDAIGKYFTFDSKKPDEIQVIGLARDAKYTSPRDDIPPTCYVSWRQFLPSVGVSTVEIRTANDPKLLTAPVREAVRQVEQNLPLNYVRTQLEQVDQTLSIERLFAKLVTLFGLLAQQLAAIGLFGVMAYAVSQRTREIGIRLALGADKRNVLRMVLRQGMTLAILGVLLGAAATWAVTRYLENKLNLKTMLFGVQVNDPWTYVSISILLTLVTLVACLIPAWRATKVDPMVALRYE